MAGDMKQRVTVTLAEELIEALDRAPGENRSEKLERLLAEALAIRAHRRWVSELEAFYAAAPPDDRREDLDWHSLADHAFGRDE
jgi:post-segregation antitoxin (ccd killing protein)